MKLCRHTLHTRCRCSDDSCARFRQVCGRCRSRKFVSDGTDCTQLRNATDLVGMIGPVQLHGTLPRAEAPFVHELLAALTLARRYELVVVILFFFEAYTALAVAAIRVTINYRHTRRSIGCSIYRCHPSVFCLHLSCLPGLTWWKTLFFELCQLKPQQMILLEKLFYYKYRSKLHFQSCGRRAFKDPGSRERQEVAETAT